MLLPFKMRKSIQRRLQPFRRLAAEAGLKTLAYQALIPYNLTRIVELATYTTKTIYMYTLTIQSLVF